MGLTFDPRTASTRSPDTVTARLQVSGQSSGQTLAFCTVMGGCGSFCTSAGWGDEVRAIVSAYLRTGVASILQAPAPATERQGLPEHGRLLSPRRYPHGGKGCRGSSRVFQRLAPDGRARSR